MTPTALDWVTLGIAFAGFLLATVSLVWQVFSWRLTGSVVKVELSRGITIGTGSPVDVVIITARNVGRTDVSVTQWGLRASSGKEKSTIVVPNPREWQGPRVPHTLPAGHSTSWYFVARELHETFSQDDAPTSVRGSVSLGTGQESKSKEEITYQAGKFHVR